MSISPAGSWPLANNHRAKFVSDLVARPGFYAAQKSAMILMNDVLVVERSRITDRLQVFATYRWGGPKPSNELRRRGPCPHSCAERRPAHRPLPRPIGRDARRYGRAGSDREGKKDFRSRSPVLLQCIKMPTDRSWCVGDPCGPGPSPAGKCFLFFLAFVPLLLRLHPQPFPSGG